MQCRRHRIHRFDPRIGKTPWSRKWQPTPVFLAWEIPWTEESGRLQSNGSQRVGQNWATKQQNLKIAFDSFYFYYLLYLLLILITSYQTKLIYHNFLSLNLLLEICPVPNDSIVFVGGPKNGTQRIQEGTSDVAIIPSKTGFISLLSWCLPGSYGLFYFM